MRKLNMKRVIIIFVPIILILACVLFWLFKDSEDIAINEEGNGKDKPTVKTVQVVDKNSDTRPISIMINNHKDAQPLQTGLNDAYMIYEIVTEGGITRMLAVFKDKDTSQVGTIRSSRHYFIDYAQENDAIYVHFGWSPQAQSMIKQLGINNVNGIADDFYWRDKTIKVASEHTAYSSMEKLNKTIAKKKYRMTSDKDLLLNYSAEDIDLSAMEGAIKADKVKIAYSTYQTNEFKYDSVTKQYVKYSNGTMRKDRLSEEPFSAKNIITYKVKNHSIDDYGRQDIDNVGNGTGYFISNGYAVPINWKKDSHSAQTVYTYQDGKEITVNDGRTYIQIQPSSQTLEITENTN